MCLDVPVPGCAWYLDVPARALPGTCHVLPGIPPATWYYIVLVQPPFLHSTSTQLQQGLYQLEWPPGSPSCSVLDALVLDTRVLVHHSGALCAFA